MNEPNSSDSAAKRHRLGKILTAVFFFALLMGPGPGLNFPFVNTAEPLFGFPAVYLWGLLWYVVEVGVVVLAYLFVWKDDEESTT